MKLFAQITTAATLIFTLAGAGWWAANNLALAEDVKEVRTKAELALDLHIQILTTQLSRLEAKRKKTRYDLDQIKYLREQINLLRGIKK